jgi:rRNA maturation endonuclease Nob1
MNEKRREQYRLGQKTFREKNRELCLYRTREIKKRWILEVRCTSCGTKLVQNEKRTCVNCGNTIKGEFKYAKDIKELTV